MADELLFDPHRVYPLKEFWATLGVSPRTGEREMARGNSAGSNPAECAACRRSRRRCTYLRPGPPARSVRPRSWSELQLAAGRRGRRGRGREGAAMSTNLARRTPDDICKEINACSIKLVEAEKKVEDWKDTRRCLILELKDSYPDVWLKEVKEKCNIGRAMAYRILQLPAAGKRKVEWKQGSQFSGSTSGIFFGGKGRAAGRAAARHCHSPVSQGPGNPGRVGRRRDVVGRVLHWSNTRSIPSSLGPRSSAC